MGNAMSGTSVDQKENVEQTFIMTQWIIQHSMLIMENETLLDIELRIICYSPIKNSANFETGQLSTLKWASPF